MKEILFSCLVVLSCYSYAQEGFPVNGVKDDRPGLYAFTNATIFLDYKTRLEKATLVIEDGKVLSAGSQVSIPDGAIVEDLNGKIIYPGLVEPYSSYGLPEVKKSNPFQGSPQYESTEKGPYGWNEAIKSGYQAVEEFAPDAKQAEDLRKIGFTSVNSFKPDGIVRGTSLFTNLSERPVQESVLQERSAVHFSFNKGPSVQQYPNSIMGIVALLRQTYYDALWYDSKANNSEVNLTLKNFNELRNLPSIFEANGGKLRVLLADNIGDEFGVQYIIKGSGDEYQRLSEIKATGASLIIPVNYPEAYDVEDPLTAIDISLSDMKHWEMAPLNAKMLTEAGVEFALTTSGLKNLSDYWSNVRKAVKYGLSEQEALKAMTFTPARYYHMEGKVGGLRKGMEANFFITSGNIFDDKTSILQTWVQGRKNEFSPLDPTDYSGKYDLKIGKIEYRMEISGKPGSQKAKIFYNDTTSVQAESTFGEAGVTFSFRKDEEGFTRLTGWSNPDGLAGTGQTGSGEWQKWSAVRKGDPDKEEKKEDAEKDSIPKYGQVIYPFVAYGRPDKPVQETILFKNATLWTLEGEGILKEADLLIKGGKIEAIGKDLSVSADKVVDATGKHLTPGIIDEHSHIALTSVNEAGQSITAEVRMRDAVDSEDIDIYRQLAGGVTAAQLLHGSANAVGGQSALIKFRWGSAPEQLLIRGADGFIKFALGENVKQSNWGDKHTVRFPQTRMGVEQVYMEGFSAAREYGLAKAKYEALSKKAKTQTSPPRKDLELETLLEIINQKRFITCHSYVQSEINMLLKVAEKFGFRVNTFTHILEGYKVADKMKEHGAGGSTFSDWWAYKYEVREAIPYNAFLMSMAGVVSAINSDDAEMARRLNQEAAKSVKYGRMDEVEALKLVTLNPARLLHLDERMGSLKEGKDADVVLWTDHPLSIYAKPEMTLVDGAVYFSLEQDAAMRAEIAAERTRLIQKMLDAKKGGAKMQKPDKKEKHRFECEDIIDENATLK